MATKIAGETYRGEAITLPLSKDGQVSVYVWPCRILNVRGMGMGGPTIGVDVGNEEVIRYDCHDTPGHWHKGGYDKLGRPGNSHTDFPDGLVRVTDQVDWALSEIKNNGAELLKFAEYNEAADLLDSSLVDSALASVRAHCVKNAGLRDEAIVDKLIDPTE
ncbi:MAG: hypothetical protein Ct9H300mP11_13030 [Chloroflexota bacterium]|nr:MAG: hypothetical protein EGP13_02245 [SAR202 cluster bacterium]MEC9013269.1 hypothetical protein [Chloroflexota bacterium]GIT01408.1 MAG: hypothetical protein CM1200mP27_00330 [Chloroflexota bacterium]GIT43367.1 MAG: hypothetical protein Ct9H300mP11_13030 [Chloroflexota bacterium]